MPEFIPVLIAAVLVFAGLLLAFGAVVTVPSAPQPSGGGPAEELRHIPLGGNFSVGYIAAELPVANISGTVSRGLLSGEDKTFSFLLSEPGSTTGGHIILHITDTNLYGRLLVSLNGQELYNDFAYPGDHSVAFGPELLQAENLLEIKAESSGWRFWAPTIYEFSADATVNWRGALTRNFTFDLSSSDVALATKGRLAINVKRKEGTGQLVATLNGNQIYADVRTAIVKDFDATSFAPGTNMLELSAPAGTRYSIDSAEVIVYFT